MRWCRTGVQEAAADGELERARAAGAELAAARASVEQLTAQLETLRAQAAATQVRGTHASLPGGCSGCSTAARGRLQLLPPCGCMERCLVSDLRLPLCLPGPL